MKLSLLAAVILITFGTVLSGKAMPNVDHLVSPDQNVDKKVRYQGCLAPYIEYSGVGCYNRSPNLMRYDEAEEYCHGIDGHLVEVTSDSERVAIEQFVNTNGMGDQWIGLTDYGRTGEYRWTFTKNKPVYWNWYPSEPDRPGEQHCVIMFEFYQYKWTDIFCDEWDAHALCESNRDYFWEGLPTNK